LNGLGRPGRLVHGLYYTLPLIHRRPDTLFVLGHMRSGSTLLAHILSSHAQIAGYGETHLSYRNSRDLARLRLHLFVRQPTARIKQRYVMDKVVNELFEVHTDVLRAPNVRALLLLREPGPTIASIRKVLTDWTEDQAVEHFVQRSRLMAECARELAGSGRAFALTHDELVHRTDAALTALTRFLGLDTPLSERYSATLTTGEWGWGDTTRRIHAGHVVREGGTASAPLTPAAEAAATAAYDECLATFRRHLPGIDTVISEEPAKSLAA
jgi:hypothetical protein